MLLKKIQIPYLNENWTCLIWRWCQVYWSSWCNSIIAGLKIEFNYIAGTSAGALVGALIANKISSVQNYV